MLAEELGVHEVPLIQKLDRWRTGVNKVLFTLPGVRAFVQYGSF